MYDNIIVFIGLLIKNKMPKKTEVEKVEGGVEKPNIKTMLMEQVWPMIPKYADLQKKKE